MRDITRKLFKHHNIEKDSIAFRAFWDEGYTVVAFADEDTNIDDILGDCFDPTVNTEIDQKELARKKKNQIQRIRDQGVWGCGLAKDGEPLYETFIWGFIGDDYIGSGYDDEIIAALSVRPVLEEI